MLVGDVRCATTGCGSSWKLSGGRHGPPAPTKVSKKRQVRRADQRAATSASSSVERLDVAGVRRAADRPAPRRGDSSQSSDERRGATARRRTRRAATSAADAGGQHDAAGHAPVERRQRRASCRAFACAAVTHSSNGAGVTSSGRACARSRRSSARPGARGASTASATCVERRPRSSPGRRAGGCASRSRAGAARRRASTGQRAPAAASVATTNVVQSQAAPSGQQPARDQQRGRRPAPSSVRRRLSSIFQRPISGMRGGRRREPKIQGSSCQSPRAQRCWRDGRDVVARRELLERARCR